MPATPHDPGPTADDVAAAMQRCDRAVRGHGLPSAARHLADLTGVLPTSGTTIEVDTYGDGGVVAELEGMLCRVLGADAAVFMPSGTMAQQIALRIHADRRGLPAVALHPTSHLVLHEDQAHERLHGLRTYPLGEAVRPWTPDDIAALPEPVAAVGIELPLRELGGLLPPWADVLGLVAASADRDAAVHLDGARLWEAAAGYDRTAAEVAAVADSTYVSFYKGLGAIAGAALVGDTDLVAAARVWRHRHGGTAYALWPYAASALHALRTRLPRMGAYLDLARRLAAGLADVAGLEVVPAEPHTSMLHLHLEVDPDAFTAAALALAREEGIATWQQVRPTVRPRWHVVELAVGDASLELGTDAILDAIIRLVEASRVSSC